MISRDALCELGESGGHGGRERDGADRGVRLPAGPPHRSGNATHAGEHLLAVYDEIPGPGERRAGLPPFFVGHTRRGLATKASRRDEQQLSRSMRRGSSSNGCIRGTSFTTPRVAVTTRILPSCSTEIETTVAVRDDNVRAGSRVAAPIAVNIVICPVIVDAQTFPSRAVSG